MIARPSTTDPGEWDAYVASARNFAEAQERIEEAAGAGVDFAALAIVQAARCDR